MTKHWFWVLFCLFLALVSFSCASKTETVNPPATVEQFGIEKFSVLKDSEGNPIPCSSDATCEGLVDKDNDCIGGTACHNGDCSVLIFDDCCDSAGWDGKDITCPGFTACGNDEECDDEDECTNDVCNAYLFGGVCTHGSVELASTTCGDGACASTGIETCEGGVWGDTCTEGTPVAETCNDIDDDCDGQIDNGNNGCGGVCPLEDLGSSCDGDDLDECEDDLYECDGINAVVCSSGEDNAETCNNADDDCDGETDEDFPIEMVEMCLVGVGQCQASGHMVCNDTYDGVVCDAVVGDPAPAELCNGLDDDCDSATDEDFTTKGQSCDGGDSDLCENGTYTCKQDGSGVECVNEVPQGWPGYEESCNNLDDDCDGQTDEDFILGAACDGADGDLCKEGVTVCKADGSDTECDDVTGTDVESCNGFDDDCDNAIDEGVQNACGSCGEVPAESCNNLDDDCDGQTDEDNPGGGGVCGQTDVGECQFGEFVCEAGKLVCGGEISPDDEICDELDNDCDGETDEDDACSTCNNPLGDIVCGQNFPGATDDGDWLNGYSCKSTLNESGSEAVFVFNNGLGGLSVMVKPINIDPATADLDVFVLSSCAASSCLKYGNTSATWSPTADTDYFVVVDGYKGASGEFDLQVTCKETTCDDSKDNDADGDTDCDDSNCVGKLGCL